MPMTPDVDLETLPKLSPSALRLLWVNDWYDGPLEAVVEHAGSACIMMLHRHEPGAERPYTWVVFKLSQEQLAEERRWHQLFAENVGQHWCFHGDAIVHPRKKGDRDPQKFYEALRERADIDLDRADAVGWVDEMPAS